ncbi:MAG: hypothetical protein J7578_02520, partial [Chitinophagaceae bacterium]|nr:hypothetical protein [Chitinophagaceae bacterium]
NKENIALKLIAKDCRYSESSIGGGTDSIWLFNLSSLDRDPIILTKPEQNGAFKILHLPAAMYRARFKNIFGQLIEKTISVGPGKFNEIVLSTDSTNADASIQKI